MAFRLGAQPFAGQRRTMPCPGGLVTRGVSRLSILQRLWHVSGEYAYCATQHNTLKTDERYHVDGRTLATLSSGDSELVGDGRGLAGSGKRQSPNNGGCPSRLRRVPGRWMV